MRAPYIINTVCGSYNFDTVGIDSVQFRRLYGHLLVLSLQERRQFWEKCGRRIIFARVPYNLSLYLNPRFLFSMYCHTRDQLKFAQFQVPAHRCPITTPARALIYRSGNRNPISFRSWIQVYMYRVWVDRGPHKHIRYT